MSRASAGTFAAFFPNAPSVLQQKRKRASHGSQITKSSEYSSCVDVVRSNSPQDGSKLQDESYDYRNGRAVNPSPLPDEEAEKSVPGDTLTGVGSDSSLASTVSSVFSHAQAHSGAAAPTSDSHTLTPMTNTESSPPRKTISPPNIRSSIERSCVNGSTNWKYPSHDSNRSVKALQSSSDRRPQARPGPGQVKGFKAVYDPELDPKLSGKDRKKHKVRYRNFGEEVRSTYFVLLGFIRYTFARTPLTRLKQFFLVGRSFASPRSPSSYRGLHARSP